GGNGGTCAVIDVKLIWVVISSIHVGQSGYDFVLDGAGRVVAHPDISVVLRGDDDPAAARLKELQQAMTAAGEETTEGINAEHRAVIAAMAPIPGPGWAAFVEEPAAEAFAPIRAALWRTGLLLLLGAVFAAGLGYLLACRMVGPIRLLGQGAEEVMGLVQEYYEALGGIITRHEATLTCFMGDGLMLLLNAPVPCPAPALRGLQMAVEMQAAMQSVVSSWRARGHEIGFGVGLAKGPATVGRIGYEGRSDY